MRPGVLDPLKGSNLAYWVVKKDTSNTYVNFLVPPTPSSIPCYPLPGCCVFCPWGGETATKPSKQVPNLLPVPSAVLLGVSGCLLGLLICRCWSMSLTISCWSFPWQGGDTSYMWSHAIWLIMFCTGDVLSNVSNVLLVVGILRES